MKKPFQGEKVEDRDDETLTNDTDHHAGKGLEDFGNDFFENHD